MFTLLTLGICRRGQHRHSPSLGYAPVKHWNRITKTAIPVDFLAHNTVVYSPLPDIVYCLWRSCVNKTRNNIWFTYKIHQQMELADFSVCDIEPSGHNATALTCKWNLKGRGRKSLIILILNRIWLYLNLMVKSKVFMCNHYSLSTYSVWNDKDSRHDTRIRRYKKSKLIQRILACAL